MKKYILRIGLYKVKPRQYEILYPKWLMTINKIDTLEPIWYKSVIIDLGRKFKLNE